MTDITSLEIARDNAFAALNAKLRPGARHADYCGELRAYNAADIAWTRAKIADIDDERTRRRQLAQALLDRLTAALTPDEARLLQDYTTLNTLNTIAQEH